MTIFASGLGAPETPRLHPEGGWLCVEMAPPRPGITRILADGTSKSIAPAGCPNGLCVDTKGNAWVADTVPPALLHVSIHGSVKTVLTEGDAGGFLLPNDLCFSPAGLLYMTDSGMLMADWVVDGAPRPDWQTARFQGKIWEIDTQARTAKAVDHGLAFANGIAFGPNGDLFANEMITGNIYRYPASNGRVSGPRTLFANVLTPDWPGGFRGPDGMCFSAEGRLWCTVYGEGCVAVLSPDGEITERIKTEGNAPTNAAFGPNGEARLYVSDHQFGRIETFKVDATALPLFDGTPQ
jgi:gluconolactonase